MERLSNRHTLNEAVTYGFDATMPLSQVEELKITLVHDPWLLIRICGKLASVQATLHESSLGDAGDTLVNTEEHDQRVGELAIKWFVQISERLNPQTGGLWPAGWPRPATVQIAKERVEDDIARSSNG